MTSWDRIHPYPLPPTVQLGMAVIGLHVQKGRRVACLTQRELAARCGLHQSTISRLENGGLRTLRLRTLALILGVLYDPTLADEPPPTRWSP